MGDGLAEPEWFQRGGNNKKRILDALPFGSAAEIIKLSRGTEFDRATIQIHFRRKSSGSTIQTHRVSIRLICRLVSSFPIHRFDRFKVLFDVIEIDISLK